jgi:hypothetical protein
MTRYGRRSLSDDAQVVRVARERDDMRNRRRPVSWPMGVASWIGFPGLTCTRDRRRTVRATGRLAADTDG